LLNSALSRSHSRQKPDRDPLGAKTDAQSSSRLTWCSGRGRAGLLCGVPFDMVAISVSEEVCGLACRVRLAEIFIPDYFNQKTHSEYFCQKKINTQYPN
jgi:hypothetical protein